MSKKVMICVTPQKACDRLIKYGFELCTEKKDELFIVHVSSYDFTFEDGSPEGEALDYLYGKAFEYAANLTIVRSNHALDTLVDLVRKNKATHVILGQSANPNSEQDMVQLLRKKIWDEAEIVVVPA